MKSASKKDLNLLLTNVIDSKNIVQVTALTHMSYTFLKCHLFSHLSPCWYWVPILDNAIASSNYDDNEFYLNHILFENTNFTHSLKYDTVKSNPLSLLCTKCYLQHEAFQLQLLLTQPCTTTHTHFRICLPLSPHLSHTFALQPQMADQYSVWRWTRSIFIGPLWCAR